MFLRWIIATLALIDLATAAPAQEHLAAVGWGMTHTGGTVSAAAPTCGGWNVAGYADGCAGAPPAGPYTVQYPNFLTDNAGAGIGVARQSSQPTYGNVSTNTGCVNPNCHPPWAIAGVDYPVGPSCGSTCGFASPGSATDPTNATSLNWGAGNPGNCTASGSPPLISCVGPMTTGTLNIGPFDWSYQGNASGVGAGLTVGTGIQVPCVIHDNNFAFDVNQTKQSSSTPVYYIQGCSSVTFKNNIFKPLDASHNLTVWSYPSNGGFTGATISGTTLTASGVTGTPVAFGAVLGAGVTPGTQITCPGGGCTTTWTVTISQTVSTPESMTTYSTFGPADFVSTEPATLATSNRPVTLRYNAFLNCPTRCLHASGDVDLAYNYFNGIQLYDLTVPGPAHGDGWYVPFTNASVGAPLNSFKEVNDTWLQPADASAGLGTNGPTSQTAGGAGITCLSCSNVITSNGVGTIAVVTNGSSNMTVVANPGTSSTGLIQVGNVPAISTSIYAYGGVGGPTRPYTLPTLAACPATGCGISVQDTPTASASGTTLTTSASITLDTNEFISPTGSTLTGVTGSGTSITATGSTGSMIVGTMISGTGIPAGTWLASGGPLNWTLNQSVTGSIGPETVTATGPSPASPTIVTGGTGTSFTLSTSVGTIASQSWIGQTGLGTYTLTAPWVSTSSGAVGTSIYPQAQVTTLDYERNTIVGNVYNTTSPSYIVGSPAFPYYPISFAISPTVWATNSTIQNNYIDVCGSLTNVGACTSGSSATATHILQPGVVTSTYAEGSNIEMNNGACLFAQGTQPATCAPIPP